MSKVYGMFKHRPYSLSDGRLAIRTPANVVCLWRCGPNGWEPPPLPPPEEPPLDDRCGGVELEKFVPDPAISPDSMEQLQETGSVPCEKHGMDHLSKDPTCEFCKKALGSMYRHLKNKYGSQITDHTPTLSFDFSGPLPVAVTGARTLMVFVWGLQEVRLIWAFALIHRAKENVLLCLQSVVADLNTLTGGSKPPWARAHADQAK